MGIYGLLCVEAFSDMSDSRKLMMPFFLRQPQQSKRMQAHGMLSNGLQQSHSLACSIIVQSPTAGIIS